MRQLSLLSAFVFSSLLSVVAQAADIPPPPILGVKSYLLLDFNSNQIIAQQAGSNRADPASLTKLMTDYLVSKALKNGQLRLDQILPVSTKALQGGGTGCGGSLGSCMFLN